MNTSQKVAMSWILFWTFWAIFILTALGVLGTLFVVDFGAVQEQERGILINFFLVETAVAVVALFYSLFNLKKSDDDRAETSNLISSAKFSDNISAESWVRSWNCSWSLNSHTEAEEKPYADDKIDITYNEKDNMLYGDAASARNHSYSVKGYVFQELGVFVYETELLGACGAFILKMDPITLTAKGQWIARVQEALGGYAGGTVSFNPAEENPRFDPKIYDVANDDL